MADNLTRGLLALALLGIAGLGLQQRSLGTELQSLRSELVAVRKQLNERPTLVLPAPAPRTMAAKHKSRKHKNRSKSTEAPRNRRQRRRERIRAKSERMHAEFATFAAEQDIDAESAAQVLEELAVAKESIALVRADVQDGLITLKEGRVEIQDVRADTDGALVEIIGSDRTDLLKGQMGEWLGTRETTP